LRRQQLLSPPLLVALSIVVIVLILLSSTALTSAYNFGTSFQLPTIDNSSTLQIIPSNFEMWVGDEIYLTLIDRTDAEDPLDVSWEARWAVSDRTIALIDEGGLLTAFRPGTVEVTATYLGKSASTQVTVLAPGAQSALMPASMTSLLQPGTDSGATDGFIDITIEYLPFEEEGAWQVLRSEHALTAHLKAQSNDTSDPLKVEGYSRIFVTMQYPTGNVSEKMVAVLWQAPYMVTKGNWTLTNVVWETCGTYLPGSPNYQPGYENLPEGTKYAVVNKGQERYVAFTFEITPSAPYLSLRPITFEAGKTYTDLEFMVVVYGLR